MRRYRTWLWAVGRLLLGLTLTCCSARAAEPAKATFWDFETSTNAWSPTEGIRLERVGGGGKRVGSLYSGCFGQGGRGDATWTLRTPPLARRSGSCTARFPWAASTTASALSRLETGVPLALPVLPNRAFLRLALAKPVAPNPPIKL
jgi:hypothetical protein